MSGLAEGAIEISRAGSDSWQALGTQREGNRLLARIDDAALARRATIVLRATARDQANNLGSTTLRLDGQPMALTLPLRVASVLQAAIAQERIVHRTIRRNGKRHRVRQRETVLRPSARVGFGRPAQVVGRLTNRDGQGIPGAEIQVLARSATSAEQPEAVLHTDGEGRYAYMAAGSSSRTLRARLRGFSGDPADAGRGRAAGAGGQLAAGESATRAQRRRGDVRWTGAHAAGSGGRQARRAAGAALGALADVPHRALGRERRWSIRYRFKRTRGVQRFRFRARLPRGGQLSVRDRQLALVARASAGPLNAARAVAPLSKPGMPPAVATTLGSLEGHEVTPNDRREIACLTASASASPTPT